MAWTNWGFDGTINEAQWAQMAGLLGNGYVAAGNGDCLVTAVAGQRKVSVATGTLYGDGVVSVNSGAEEVTLTTPANGQWYVIALRRTWATNTAALVAIAGATTTTTTPTAPPTSFPTLNTNVGVLTDQPIAWAWCNSANTTVVVYDIRLKAVKSLPPVVANSTERDAKFMTPTQGLQVWRDDLGAVETYYGLYNVSTNPGGRDSAGWYTTNRASGLVPIKPTTVTIATGTGTSNALGAVSFSGATSVFLDGVFSAEYKNYLIQIAITGGTTDADTGWRFLQSGTPVTSSTYQWVNVEGTPGATSPGLRNAAGTTSAWFGFATSAQATGATIVLRAPNEAIQKTWNHQLSGHLGVTNFIDIGGGNSSTFASAATGIGFYIFAGNFTGTVQVFGYND